MIFALLSGCLSCLLSLGHRQFRQFLLKVLSVQQGTPARVQGPHPPNAIFLAL